MTTARLLQSISNVSIGSVNVRLKVQKQLDSYSEEDLIVLKEKWNNALSRRRTYLHQQVEWSSIVESLVI